MNFYFALARIFFKILLRDLEIYPSSFHAASIGGLRKTDSRTLNLIERAYTDLRSKKSKSLLKKHLTPEIFDRIKHRLTSNGGSLLDVMKLGLADPDTPIGVTAVDAESYFVFEELFNPIIRDYHDIVDNNLVHPQVDSVTGELVGDFNDFGKYIVSTRVRCVRNIDGYPFPPLMTKDQFSKLEKEVQRTLKKLDGPLKGKYETVAKVSSPGTKKLLEQFSESSNKGRFWPTGRGIFYNEDSTLVVLVNDKNHLKVISLQEGGNLNEVYDRFVKAVNTIDETFSFTFSSKIGHLTVCPTNLGSATRSSIRMQLPCLKREPQMLEETAEKFNLQVDRVKGAKEGDFDLTYRWRLSQSQDVSLLEMYSGILEVFSLEKRLEHSKKMDRR